MGEVRTRGQGGHAEWGATAWTMHVPSSSLLLAQKVISTVPKGALLCVGRATFAGCPFRPYPPPPLSPECKFA